MMKVLFFILTVMSLRVSAADQVAPAKDAQYAIVMSKGHRAADLDVLISSHQGLLYSFKYCRAHDAKGQPTNISEIRRNFLLGGLNNKEKINQLIESLFESSDCESIGANAYATFDTSEIWQCGKHTEFDGSFPVFNIGIGISGVASFFGGYHLSDQIRGARYSHNTESFLRFLTSNKFPHAQAAREITYLSVLVGLAYTNFIYVPAKENYLNDFSSLSFCQGGEKNLRLVESMSDFKKSFQTGLKHALKAGAFSEL